MLFFPHLSHWQSLQMPAFNWRQISTVGAICYFNSFSTRAFEYNCKRCCLIFMAFSPLNRHTNKIRTSLTMPSLPPPFTPAVRGALDVDASHTTTTTNPVCPESDGNDRIFNLPTGKHHKGRKTFRNPIITWISMETRLSLLSAFHYTIHIPTL